MLTTLCPVPPHRSSNPVVAEILNKANQAAAVAANARAPQVGWGGVGWGGGMHLRSYKMEAKTCQTMDPSPRTLNPEP